MANVLSLAMKLTASAAGMRQGVSESEKLLKGLSRQAESAGRGFEAFRDSSGNIPAVMQDLAGDLQLLASAFREGLISADDFKARFAETTAAARELSAAFKEGAAVTERVKTDEERRTETLTRLKQLLEAGAISQQTFARASAEADGSNQRAAEAERKRAAAVQDAQRIIAANLTSQERYDNEVQELRAHLEAGRLSQEQYNRAVASAKASFDRASAGASKFDAVTDSANAAGLKFNELSGVLSALPGPLGGIAGRISGIASASEGLGRVFAGGIGPGISSVIGSLTSLINPVTAALAGIAAFGAAATAVVKSLIALEDRVERLSVEASKLGVSFQFMQTLETAANRTGSSIDGLRITFTALLRNIDAARDGSQGTITAFQKLGVSAEDLATKTPEALFKQIALSINDIPDPAQRAAAALKTLGENGARLLPTFAAIADAERDLSLFNAELSDVNTANIVELGNNFDDLSLATQGLGQSLVTPFTGFVEAISGGLASGIATLGKNIEALLDFLSPIITAFGVAAEAVVGLASVLSNAIGIALEPFAAQSQNINQVLIATGRVMQDVFDAINEGINYVRDLIRSFLDFTSVGDSLSSVFSSIGEVIGRIVRIVQQVAENVAVYVGRIIERFTEFVASHPLVAAAVEAIGAAFASVASMVASFVSSFAAAADSVLSWIEWFVGVESEIPEVTPGVDDSQLQGASLAATQFYDEITAASEAAAELGEEGFNAAVKYQAALEEIAQLQAEGELSQEEATRAAAQATAEFERQTDALRERQEAERKAADEQRRAAEALAKSDQSRIDRLLEQQRIEAEFGGDPARFQAAENVAAIDRERLRIEQEIAAARERGDDTEAASLSIELAQLDQLRAAQDDVASGARGIREAIAEVSASVNDAIVDAASLGPSTARAIEEFQSVIEDLELDLQLELITEEEFRKASERARKVFDEQVKQAEEVAKLRERLAETQADIDRERLESLQERRQEPLNVADVRSQEGAANLIALATGREDPAVAEYRKQLSKLDEIKREISKVGGTVEMV